MYKRINTFLKIFFITLLLLIVIDQLLAFIRPNFLFPAHYDISNLHRHPKPYIEFSGAPLALDHDENGYRKSSNRHYHEGVNIAFFGGSTGYDGDPPIANLLEDLLRKIYGPNINVKNFSVVSSNHRQHLHNIIESNNFFKPDLIFFYGGYNETAQSAFYDPRPGYPYNFFYRAELPAWKKFLLEQSPIANLINRVGVKFGAFDLTRLSSIRKEVDLSSERWQSDIHDNYFSTLHTANTIAKSLGLNRCQLDTNFRAFYQPYQIPSFLEPLDEKIRSSIHKFSYIFDISDTLKNKEFVFTDIVHVSQEGNELIAKRIFNLLKNDKFINECFLKFVNSNK